MRSTARISRWVLFASLAVVVIAMIPVSAGAQSALWDHYKRYAITPPITAGLPPINLFDQWGSSQHQSVVMEFFMNPTEKTVFDPPPGQTYPINRPELHYSWWRLNQTPFTPRTILTTDQFGNHTLVITQAIFLLNPALKSHTTEPPQGPLPVANHYKCYECNGSPVGIGVRLTDQFGPFQTTVAFPRYFCNPAEKQVGGIPPYPIVDPEQHYTCYQLSPTDPRNFPVIISDQFVINRQTMMVNGDLLCVPTLKHDPVGVESSTWGNVKGLYR